MVDEVCGLSSTLDTEINMEEAKLRWESFQKSSQVLNEEFEQWSHNMSTTSENFKYWSNFIDKIIPILNDLTLYFRNAIPLFFTFGRTNYCCWTPIYLEDCKNLVSTRLSRKVTLWSIIQQGKVVDCPLTRPWKRLTISQPKVLVVS